MVNKHLAPYSTSISRESRSAIKGHQPAVLWFTGLSGSGKSSIANRVEHTLVNSFHAHTYLLDGDNLRSGMNSDLGFSLADRSENIRRTGEAARLLADAGLIVLTAFISPLLSDRDRNRSLLNDYNFLEIFVDCPLEVCESRDAKGLYAKARAGEILEFTGISSVYEAPIHPELVLRTNDLSVEVCSAKVIILLLEKNIISEPQKIPGER